MPTMRRARRVLSVVAVALIAAATTLVAVLTSSPTPPACVRLGPPTIGKKQFPAPPCNTIDRPRDELYIVRLETTMGLVVLRLDPVLAPETVNNVVFLARAGFYDGLTFHRVERAPDHALVQTGDPTGTGRGGPGYTYQGTTPSPITRYIRGVVAMANTGTPASNASQFFIVVRDYDALGPPTTTPRYTFFGIVADSASLAVLDRMVAVPLDGTRPRTPIRITRATVEQIARHPSPAAS